MKILQRRRMCIAAAVKRYKSELLFLLGTPCLLGFCDTVPLAFFGRRGILGSVKRDEIEKKTYKE